MWSHRRNRYEKKPHRHEMIALSQLQIQPVIENANKMFFVEEPVDKLDTEGITQMPDLYKQMFHRRCKSTPQTLPLLLPRLLSCLAPSFTSTRPIPKPLSCLIFLVP